MDVFAFNTVARMAIHRGDYDLHDIDIRSKSKTPPVWPHWTSHIRSNLNHAAAPRKASIDEDINSSLKREVNRCIRDIIRLFCRWAPPVHTLLTSWGEATIVLEDVFALTGLPIHGSHSYDEEAVYRALNDEDKELCTYLLKCKDDSRRELVRKSQAPSGKVKDKGAADTGKKGASSSAQKGKAKWVEEKKAPPKLPSGDRLLSSSIYAYESIHGSSDPTETNPEWVVKVNRRASFSLWLKYWAPQMVGGNMFPPKHK